MTPSRVINRLTRTATGTLLTAALAASLTLTAPLPAEAATPRPAVPSGLPTAIEQPSSYVPANSCDPRPKAGTVALAELLTSTYPGTSAGLSRNCGVGQLPTSEHYDGRAVDWMASVRDKRQAAQARAVVAWLTAPDADGNAFANARRLG